MNKLLVSVSGGRTSAFMAKKLKDEYSARYEMIFVFANTGQEWEETLRFVKRCSDEWKLDTVWVESVVHHGERKGCSHKVVTFETAARNGEPFEEVIKKYGIPNQTFPHCTRELKLNPITSYAESIGWVDYVSAVGIRADEPSRLRDDAEEAHIVYPLAHWFPTTKPEINDWFSEQSFNLNLLEHQGNCTWCWKKSMKKHMMIAKETPEVFDFPARMEATYGTVGARREGMPLSRTFFRKWRSTKDLITLAELLDPPAAAPQEDEDAGCSESCEAFGK